MFRVILNPKDIDILKKTEAYKFFGLPNSRLDENRLHNLPRKVSSNEFKEQLNDDELNRYGASIEIHERFPNKVNVEFVKIMTDEECIVRVFERGVGITKSCGTGACASVVAGSILGLLKKNTPIKVHNDGGDLKITYMGNTVLMEGAVNKVFEGIIDSIEI